MPDPSHQLFELLLGLFRRIVRREKALKGYATLSPPQVVILDALQRRARYKMRELSSLLGIGMSAATGLADRLVKAGYVTRERDSKDRRVVWVSIAPKGRTTFRQFRLARQRTFQAMFKGLSEKERALFLALFRRAASNLEEHSP